MFTSYLKEFPFRIKSTQQHCMLELKTFIRGGGRFRVREAGIIMDSDMKEKIEGEGEVGTNL